MRRSMALMMVILLIVASMVAPRRADAIGPVIVGQLAKKGVERALATAMVRAAGAKGTKSAMQRAQEIWFSRLDEDSVSAIRQAAQRAEPVPEKPGWYRAIITGALMITGIDLLLDVYNLIRTVSEVDLNTDDPTDSEILSSDGEYLGIAIIGSYWYVAVYQGGKIVGTVYGYGDKLSVSQPISMVYKYTDYEHGLDWYRLSYRYDGELVTRDIPNPSSYASYYYVEVPSTDASIELEPSPFPELDPSREYVIEFPDPEIYPEEVPQPVIQPRPEPSPEPLPEPSPEPSPQPEPSPEPAPEPSPEPAPQPGDGEMTPDQLNWEPLKRAGEIFTNKFPFSLPWDIMRLLESLTASTSPPTVTLRFPVPGMGDVIMYSGPVIPEAWAGFVPYVRTGLLIVFGVGLVYATRRLLGGSV